MLRKTSYDGFEQLVSLVLGRATSMWKRNDVHEYFRPVVSPTK